MANPGTEPPPSKRTSRMASMAWAKVATNRPMANWLGLSRRNVCTIRGENCPMASWTTTMVMVRTSAARLTIEPATVERIWMAASGPPVNDHHDEDDQRRRGAACGQRHQHGHGAGGDGAEDGDEGHEEGEDADRD